MNSPQANGVLTTSFAMMTDKNSLLPYNKVSKRPLATDPLKTNAERLPFLCLAPQKNPYLLSGMGSPEVTRRKAQIVGNLQESLE
jgi:hypothetical protein